MENKKGVLFGIKVSVLVIVKPTFSASPWLHRFSTACYKRYIRQKFDINVSKSWNFAE